MAGPVGPRPAGSRSITDTAPAPTAGETAPAATTTGTLANTSTLDAGAPARPAVSADVAAGTQARALGADAMARGRFETTSPGTATVDTTRTPRQAEFYDERTLPRAFRAQYQAVKEAYAPANVVCLRSPGNGERPVFAAAGKDFDPARPFNVQTHYHGLGSSAEKGPHTGALKDMLGKTEPQTLVVLPESRNMATDRWNNVTSEKQTTLDAEAAVRRSLRDPAEWNVREHTASFHSAGGDVLRRVAKDSADGLLADHVELLDCLYNNDVLTQKGYAPITDSVVRLGRQNQDADFNYRRFENAEKAVAPDGTRKLRGQAIQDALGSARFHITEPYPTNPDGARSHDDTAIRFLGHR